MPYKNLEMRREYSRKYYREHKDHHRETCRAYRMKHGAYMFPSRPWSLEEDLLVLEHSMKYREIAELLGRSYESIKSRRKKLNAMFKMHMV